MKELANQPLVSVVITAYNAERFIAETLESIFAQTYSNFEVLIADDGSTDGTRDLVQSRFPKAHYFWQLNAGQPSARNLGIIHAQGDLIAFVDSDDLWLPKKLESQVRLFIEDPTLAWSYTDCYGFVNCPDNITDRISRLAKPFTGSILPQLFLNNFIQSPSVMIRKEVFDTVGLWDECRFVAEDWNMWLRIAAHFPIKYLDEPLALYRRHDANLGSQINPQTNLDQQLEILQEALDRNPEQLRPIWRPALAQVHFKCSLVFLKRGMNNRGRLCIARAIWHNPWKLSYYGFLSAALLPTEAIRSFNWVRRKWRQKRI